MKETRGLTALFSGLVMYGFCWTVAWLLAQISLPTEDFPHALFGRGSLAAILSEAGAIALLLFAIALPWSYFAVRSSKRRMRPSTAWFLTGLGLAWFAGLMTGVFRLSGAESDPDQSIGVLLLSATQPPLWGLLNSFALFLGALLAGILAGNHYRKLGGGHGRTINAKYASNRDESRRNLPSPGRNNAGTADSGSAWDATSPMPDLPETTQRLPLRMGQTGR